MTPKEIIQKFSEVATGKVHLASLIALHFHEGQWRKVEDAPYIVHPARIAAQLNTEEDKCIAWLHDVVEDSEVTLEDLKDFFSEEIISGVNALTKIEDNEEATLAKIRAAPKNVQYIKLLDVLDYWQHSTGMKKESLEKNKTKALEFYLPLAKKNKEQQLLLEIERAIANSYSQQ